MVRRSRRLAPQHAPRLGVGVALALALALAASCTQTPADEDLP